MDGKKSEKPENNEPKAEEGKAPNKGKADNQVIAAQSANKDVGSQKVADGPGAPKDGEKGGGKAGDTYDLRTFLHLSNLAKDQTHAFGLWAQHENWGKLSLDSWSKRYEDFLKRPV